MANTYKPKATEICITGIGSYLNLWEPRAFGANDPKYSMVIIFKKSDQKQYEAVKKAIEAAEELAIDKVWKGKRPGKVNFPIHDGDVERPDQPEYAGMYYINCSNRDKPGVVDQKVQPILDREMIYSGCIVNCFVNFYGYSQNGNNGISASLENVQLVSDGKRLSGKQPAGNVFAPITEEDLAEIDGYASSTYSKGEIDAALQGKQDRLALDNAPTQGSDNPVKSGGVYAALAAKQPVLVFDPVPTQGSQNPVSSGGVCAALAGKQNDLTQAPSVSSLLETDYLFLERGGAICKIRASAVIIPSGSGGDGIEAGDGSAILTEDGQEILPDGVAM